MITRAALLPLVLLLSGAAPARGDVPLELLKELRQDGVPGAAASTAGGTDRLPLRGRTVRRTIVTPGLADRARPTRVLVSVRRHREVPAVRELIARAGGERVRTLDLLGVIAATAPEPRRLVSALDGDPRVVAVERNVKRRLAAEPADAVDPRTRIPFAWHYDAVNAGEALAAIGGKSRFRIAVVDSGLDVRHGEFGPNVAGNFDLVSRRPQVFDDVGHGTFVTGLIAADPDNGRGLAGVAGDTPVSMFKVDDGQGGISVEAIAAALQRAIRRKISVVNLSLGGQELTRTESRALKAAFFEDVLPVAAAGNGATAGNPIEYPAAALTSPFGGLDGIGLSVGATTEKGQPTAFSTHNRFVSIAAPGGSDPLRRGGRVKGSCGVYSTLPRNPTLLFDGPGCRKNFGRLGTDRYGYSEGTSFATPIVAGIASVAWEAEPRLASEQVVRILLRSARQTFGTRRWNGYTGRGVVDAAAAVALARRFDVTAPDFTSKVTRVGRGKIRVQLSGKSDRTEPGRELAGGVGYRVVRVGDGSDARVLRLTPRAVDGVFAAPADGVELAIGACDRVNNCAFDFALREDIPRVGTPSPPGS